jgi:hypothetical protein
MSGLPLLETGLLLGLYVLLAGAWGLLYTLGRLLGWRVLRHAAAAAYGLHVLVALGAILWTPLGFGWKCLIAASTAGFRALPPILWHFLEATHRNGGSAHDRQSSQHPGRIVARL